MTGITTAAGSIALLLSFGAGTETRIVIGTVILSGVLAAAASAPVGVVPAQAAALPPSP